jgi:peptide/nickel transport system substrate-binding protein
MSRLAPFIVTCAMVVLAGCAPARPEQAGQPNVNTATAVQRTLVLVVRGEPPSLAAKPVTAFSNALGRPSYLFNATLDYRDEHENTHPYLAEALPQLGEDTWRVLPDGRMETTYHLKPNLTWQDGVSLTADDFVFAYHVYKTPDFGVSKSPPLSFIEDVTAPDASTVVVHWNQVYPDASAFSRGTEEDGLPPLPRHILEQPFNDLDPGAFGGLPFWTTDYIGLGPYKVSGWEPGAYVEGTAFDGYVLGKPRIEELKVQFISDPQTAVANILSGDAHYITDPVLAVSDGLVLEQQWAQNKRGEVLYSPIALRTSVFQLRPDVVESPAFLDVRVRQAIAHAIDRQTVVEALTAGKGIVTDTLTSPRAPYYDQIEPAIRKYPYDPRQAQQLMQQGGYPLGEGNLFRGPTGDT